jgi:hypothetical protein
MAFKKQQTFKGITVPSAYAKICESTVRDYMDGETKKYTVQVKIGIFTDSTKAYQIRTVRDRVSGLLETQLTLTEVYNNLKSRSIPATDGIDEPLEDWSAWTSA